MLLFTFTVAVIELGGQPVDGSEAVNVTVYVPCEAQVTVCGPKVLAVAGEPLGNDHAYVVNPVVPVVVLVNVRVN